MRTDHLNVLAHDKNNVNDLVSELLFGDDSSLDAIAALDEVEMLLRAIVVDDVKPEHIQSVLQAMERFAEHKVESESYYAKRYEEIKVTL